MVMMVLFILLVTNKMKNVLKIYYLKSIKCIILPQMTGSIKNFENGGKKYVFCDWR